LLIRHLTKQAGGKAIHRGLGSIDLTGAVRSELLAGSLPDDPDSRALIHIKGNVGHLGPSLNYRIDQDGCFSWIGESTITAEELLAAPASPGEQKLDGAMDWLKELLRATDRKAREVRVLAEGAGISRITLRRAKDALHVRSYKTSGMDGDWMLSLRDVVDDAHTENMINIGAIEQVRCCSSPTKVINITPLDSDLAQKDYMSTFMRNFDNDSEGVLKIHEKVSDPALHSCDLEETVSQLPSQITSRSNAAREGEHVTVIGRHNKRVGFGLGRNRRMGTI